MDKEPAPRPCASVIVPAHDAAATIGRTLACLAEQDVGEPFEVIVVDDGSRDDTAAIASSAPGAISVVASDRRGPGSARNIGARRASSDVLGFLDADCFPEPGWLRAGLAALADAELVQGAVRPDPSAALGPFDRTLWVLEDIGLYQTANLMVRRETFERIGGFDAWVTPGADSRGHFGEDVVFAWRARRLGARVVFAPEAAVHHAVFHRSAAEYVRERARLAHFPVLTARVPELRGSMYYRRWFLSRRSAALDLALLGAAGALVTRSPLPLLAAAPYTASTLRASRRWGRRASKIAIAELAADLFGFTSLLAGSIRSRRLVL
jgi:glycosyltransferase involved in cell wall biosynthesis